MVGSHFFHGMVLTKNSRHQKHQNKIILADSQGRGSSTRLPPLRSPLRPLPRTPISPAPGPRTHISLAAPPLSDSDPLSPLPCDASLRLHSPLKVSTRFSIGSGHAALDVLAFNSPRFSRQSGRLTISGIFPTGMQSLALLNWMASRYMHPKNLISSMSPDS